MLCRLCGSENKKNIITENNYDIIKCLNCGFLFIDKNFLSGDLIKAYDDYYAGKTDDEIFDKAHVRNNIYQHISKKISSLIPGKGKLLDVGAAFGNFIDIARRSDWDCFGLEINQRAVNFLQNRLKINSDSIDLLDFSPISFFNAITFIDVLEHVNRPLEYLKKSNELLDEGGIIYIRLPNAQFHINKTLFFKFFNKSYKGLEVPHHICHFTPETLESALRIAGFTDVRITPSLQDMERKSLIKKFYQSFVKILYSIFGSLRFANLIEATARKKQL